MAKSRRNTADSYTLRARKEGYPARSVYKLEEIQKQFAIIKKGDTVLMGRPGFMDPFTNNVLLKGVGKIVAVDLNPLSINPIPHTVISYVGDAFGNEISRNSSNMDRMMIIAMQPADDGKPRQIPPAASIAEQVILLGAEHLKTGGNLVVKLSRRRGTGADEELTFSSPGLRS